MIGNLENTNTRFKGFILYPQLFNPKTSRVIHYDFRNRKLLNNFQLYINPNLTQIRNILNRNRNEDEKADFSEGIKTFGLDKERTKYIKLRYNIAKITKFVNKYL
jgi:hypothetical protein